jgi:thymidylate synthase
MTDKFIGDTLASVYPHVLRTLLNDPEHVSSPRQMICNELTDVKIVINDPRSNLYTNATRSSQKRYIAAELLWYYSGSRTASVISKHAPFWRQIANEDGSVNSAYGNLIFNEHAGHMINEWSWAKLKLTEDKHTRQSVIRFNKSHHNDKASKDFPCTMYGIFSIRQNRLNFSVHMRSNDAILGLPTDIAFFTTLQLQMLESLQETVYPELELGHYVHTANSLHLYERDFEKVKQMIKTSFEPVSMAQYAGGLHDNIGMSDAMKLLNRHFQANTPFTDELVEKSTVQKNSVLSWIAENYVPGKH